MFVYIADNVLHVYMSHSPNGYCQYLNLSLHPTKEFIESFYKYKGLLSLPISFRHSAPPMEYFNDSLKTNLDYSFDKNADASKWVTVDNSGQVDGLALIANNDDSNLIPHRHSFGKIDTIYSLILSNTEFYTINIRRLLDRRRVNYCHETIIEVLRQSICSQDRITSFHIAVPDLLRTLNEDMPMSDIMDMWQFREDTLNHEVVELSLEDLRHFTFDELHSIT